MKSSVRPVSLLATLLVVSCGSDSPSSTPNDAAAVDSAPTAADARVLADTGPSVATLLAGRARWKSTGALAPIDDSDPDPRVTSISLEARIADVTYAPGKTVKAWTYNGLIPGGEVRARKGDLFNAVFTNNLPEPTTIHWHGVRVPVEMDGAPDVSQPPVAPGTTFTYSFMLPDAGLYWFHPHVAASKQVGYGLFVPLVVEDPAEPAGLGEDVVLVFSDLDIDLGGQLASADKGGQMATQDGREGEVVLVNGAVAPTLLARRGLRQRWRMLNAARSRYFKIALPGHTFQVIGADGGLAESAVERTEILVTPGERIEAVVTPQGTPGTPLGVSLIPYNRGARYTPGPANLFYVELTGEPPVESPPLPARLRTIAPIDTTGATPVAVSWSLATDGFHTDGAKGLEARVGETQVWTIANNTNYDHPFHLHGFFFQVLDPTTGLPAQPLGWRDTVNIPKGALKMAVTYDDRPGMWMFHCHILDHAEFGLLSMIHVHR